MWSVILAEEAPNESLYNLFISFMMSDDEFQGRIQEQHVVAVLSPYLYRINATK